MKRILFICAAALTAGCSGADKKTEPTNASAAPATWSGKMQDLNQTLSSLVPFVYDDRKFNDPGNFSKINDYTEKLAHLAHDLESKKEGSVTAPNPDPALKFLSSQFKEDLKRAHESLISDHRVYARSVLKTSISYCISCHTRTDSGPKFDFESDPEFLGSLQPIERARFYAATRQYEAGLKVFLGILENPATGERRPFDIEKAARSALAISVRVLKDPDQSLRIAKDVVNKPATPLFVRNDAETWVTAIQAWKKEGKKPLTNETAVVNKIRSLVKQAEAVQRYPADLKGDIYYLRATALIHEYFSRFPDPKDPAEVYRLAGLSYEALKDLGFWTLHELYYERCIREKPHSALARQCYEQFEQSVLLGYSGSAGLFLPAGVAKQLEELRSLATIK